MPADEAAGFKNSLTHDDMTGDFQLIAKLTTQIFALALAALIGAAAFAPGLAHADSPRKALNMFGGMVDTMVGIAAAQEEAKAAAAEPAEKCWTEKRTTKSAGKTVVKTVKVCE